MADITGTGGNDTLPGTAGDDTINGLGGNDTLSGGSGADVFVFQAAGGNGLDTITDFDPAVDTFRIETGNLDFDADNVWYEMRDNQDIRVIMDTNGNGQWDDSDEYVVLSGILNGIDTGISGASILFQSGGGFSFTDFSFGDDDIDFVSSSVTQPEPETPPPTGTLTGDSNTLTGTAGDDELPGTAGADIINGLGGDDTLSGGSGADVFVFQAAGGNGLDTITDFDPAVDTFRIETGNLDFDADNVWYEMRDNQDIRVIMDTNGNGQWDDSDEYVVLSGILNGIDTGISGASILFQSGGGFSFTDFSFGDDDIDFVSSSVTQPEPETPPPTGTLTGDSNTLTGTAGDDELPGTAGADIINGLGGDDTLSGGSGADVFVFQAAGGNGLDTITDFDPAVDTFRIETGNLDFDADNVWYEMRDNQDIRVIMDTNGNGQWDDSDEYVVLSGILNGIDTGISGASILFQSGGGFSFTDFSFGDDDIDFVSSSVTQPEPETPPPTGTLTGDSDTLTGTAGDDELPGTAGADIINGLGGDDVLNGGDGVDRLNGGAGEDVLDGGAGEDVLDGGAGVDGAFYGLSPAGVTIDLSATPDADGYVRGAGGDAEGDRLKNIEYLVGSFYGAGADKLDGGAGVDGAFYDRLTGDDNDNLFWGLGGDDTLTGGSGNDLLGGGAGADKLDGGAGVDGAFYGLSPAGVTIDLSATPDADGYVRGAGGEAEGDRLKNIEDLEGSFYGDRLTGDDNDNLFWGLGGDDTLTGGDGEDELIGGDGDDTLTGGPGADTLDGGEGQDLLSYAGSDGPVTVRLYDGLARRGHAEGDTISGFEHLRGSAYADALAGTGKGNWLDGGAGNDRLLGGSGNDLLGGGAGADKLDGGAGVDGAFYGLSPAGVTIDLSATPDADGYVRGAGGDAEGDRLKDIEHLWGSAYGDILTGDGGDNILFGNDGDDLLNGGGGADWLIGGYGEDTVSYAGSPAGVIVRLHAHRASGGDAEGDTFELITWTYTDKGETLSVQVPDIAHLTGSGSDDLLAGDVRANILRGGGGADTLYGGPGGSEINDDWMYGEDGDDKLYGGHGRDKLYGGRGADSLNGGMGADELEGGADNDTLSGGPGADWFVFGSGSGDDTIKDFEAGSDEIWVAQSGITFSDLRIEANGGNARIGWGNSGQTVTLTGVSHTALTADSFRFFEGRENGFAPTDQAAFDALAVGLRFETPGDSSYYLDFVSPGRFREEFEEGEVYTGRYTYEKTGPNSGKFDSVYDDGDRYSTSVEFESATTGVDAEGARWQLVTSPLDLDDATGDDTLTGTADADTLIGTAGADTISGLGGDDTINGLAGDDILNGNAGNDTLTGGSGADRFVFGAGNGDDAILDFSLGEDKILLDDDLRITDWNVVDAIGSWSVEVSGDDTLTIFISDTATIALDLSDGSTVKVTMDEYDGPSLSIVGDFLEFI